MKTIYFVRHGECVANAEGVLAGSTNDSPLTEKGEQQAKEAAALVANLPVQVMVVSPLIRAKLTAEIILHNVTFKGRVVTNALFVERDFGSATGKPRDEGIDLLESGRAKGVESLEAFYQRASNALSFLRSLPEEHILVVSHSGFARMLGTVVSGAKPEDFLKHKALDNAEIFEFTLQ